MAGLIFQQDNAGPQGCHNTATTTLLHFPGLLDSQICHQSSISEIIWDGKVGQPTSLIELEVRLQQLWNGISQEIIRNLYVSIPARIASCIHARRCPTEY
ncbi:hypothetical protein TNCV_3461701 [Trichonephila clavipes]|nr:hypothetical protein TNCV_3461701 [Trichonephila clavipes]